MIHEGCLNGETAQSEHARVVAGKKVMRDVEIFCLGILVVTVVSTVLVENYSSRYRHIEIARVLPFPAMAMTGERLPAEFEGATRASLVIASTSCPVCATPWVSGSAGTTQTAGRTYLTQTMRDWRHAGTTRRSLTPIVNIVD